MRKLVRLTYILISPFLLIYFGIVTGLIPKCHSDITNILLLAIKIYFFAACMALGRVLQLTFNFNNCKTAAEELKQEVIQAKEDLKRKVFNFK